MKITMSQENSVNTGRTPDRPASNLGLDSDRWLDVVKEFGRHFLTCAGSEERIRAYCQRRATRLAPGACTARGLYSRVA